MKYITEGESAYIVRLPPTWTSVSFSFIKFGGKRLAKKAASTYVKENSVKCDDHKGHTSSKSKLEGETIGVNFEKIKSKSGQVATYWTASYQDDTVTPPKQRKKRYSISKYGDLAKEKAITFREEKMGKLKPTER